MAEPISHSSQEYSTKELFTGRRLATLVGSLIVALCSGTNYAFSAYAPQLGSRLQISHTKLNIIALAGNVGVYSTGPPFGWVVDRKGPRPLLVTAFFCLFLGYFGIRYFYVNVDVNGDTDLQPEPVGAERLSAFAFGLLVLCSYLSGAGGSAGLCSSINSTAKTFPDKVRASTTGLVISGFGLSAFFFSALAHLFFPGDVGALLLLLSLGTSLPMIGGYFVVRPIPLPDTSYQPLPATQDDVDVENLDYGRPRRPSLADIPQDGFAHVAGVDGVLTEDVLVYEHLDDSRAHLLLGGSRTDLERESTFEHEDHNDQGPMSRSLELSVSPPRRESHKTARKRRDSSVRLGKSHSRNRSKVIEVMSEKHGKELLKSPEFWMLATMLTLLSGTGLMYINNVGSISQALFAQGNPDFDATEATKWQAFQVSVISVTNCAGRILIGLGADLMKNQAHAPRSYCICIVASVFILSQIYVTQIERVDDLWVASGLLGLAYGGVFGLFPTIAIEWFGLTHFSENWGYVSMAPMVGGNLFSLAFGLNLDKHASHMPGTPHGSNTTHHFLARAPVLDKQQCFEGRECYVSSLYLTILACFVALGISVVSARRDKKRMTVTDVPPLDEDPEVIWEGRD